LTGSLGRIVALALALSIVIGAWLLFEYSETSRQRRAVERSEGGPDASGPRVVDPSRPSAGTRRDPAHSPPDTVGRPSGSLIYKCRGPSGTAYRDHPCSSKETELQVTVAGPISAPRYDLEQLKAKADEMEAARLQRAASQTAPQTQADRSTRDSRKTECDDLDRRITEVDARLRQPHSASEGDFWTGERRKLTDRRFSVGC
jgi:hypothetical protein